MTVTIDQTRLARITTLAYGAHEPPNGHMKACAMEAAAYVAGEPWSDRPECVCPVIATFMRGWNDGLPNDAERTTLLLPFVTRVIGTRGSKEIEERRATMAADWYIRTFTPAWLRLAGLTQHADTLASVPEITDFAAVPSLRPALEAAGADAAAAGDAAEAAARAAAGAAAGDAAWAAAWDTAGDAAGDAAWDAAGDAAWEAAGDAARAAAWDAAWDAVGAAARAAAWDALKPTHDELQRSAVALLDRMISLTDADLTEAA